MNILTATERYEQWLAANVPFKLVADDLDLKHTLMANREDPFPFFRGTYYRWAQHWAEAAGALASAPRVLAIGDIHVENYGTWRDAEGRLCWGVNDFDEIDELPYAHDLVRLAASVRMARKSKVLSVKTDDACAAIVAGYSDSLKAGGTPFVLEEEHSHLRALATSAERSPEKFWAKMMKNPPASVPEEARKALESALPAAGEKVSFRARPGAGVGSLGRPRYVALAHWAGGMVCREVKTAAPPATAWALQTATPTRSAEAVRRAKRAHDPYYRPDSRWVVRRLGPHTSRIELSSKDVAIPDELLILNAMGAELANVHLGTAGKEKEVLADLGKQPSGWLAGAARAFSDLIEKDWAEWKAKPA